MLFCVKSVLTYLYLNFKYLTTYFNKIEKKQINENIYSTFMQYISELFNCK